MEKFFEAQEDDVNQNGMKKPCKEILAFLDTFWTFMVQHNKAMLQHNEVAKIMGQYA